MKWTDYNIEIITPCFCAGADQSKAEIRVPSIRGQLRWWFRALGGTREQEMDVFGGVHGEAKASTVRLRVSQVRRGTAIQLPSMKMGQPGAYLWYFATVSGDKKRWWKEPPGRGSAGLQNPDGYLPPETTFQMSVAKMHPLADDVNQLFEKALECFLRFGGLGMRLTRAMGAIHCQQYGGELSAYRSSAEALLVPAGFAVKWCGEHREWFGAVKEAEDELKRLRGENKSTGRPSPLGSAKPRQASSVYFRPLRLDGGKYSLFLFEAPHNRVLGEASRRSIPLLAMP